MSVLESSCSSLHKMNQWSSHRSPVYFPETHNCFSRNTAANSAVIITLTFWRRVISISDSKMDWKQNLDRHLTETVPNYKVTLLFQ